MTPWPASRTIILVSKRDDHHVRRLSDKLKESLSVVRILRFYSLDELASAMVDVDKASTILVLMLHGDDMAESFVFLRRDRALRTSRMILILPETEGPLMQTALSLRPSYITHLESAYDDVMDVLLKMGMPLPA